VCLVVFAGSKAPLPLVAWDEAAPAFHVTEAKGDEPARAFLGMPYVYELGSHQGCGCGYSPGHQEAAETNSAREKSRAALMEYLRAALASGPIRLFAGWNGWAERAPIDGQVALAALGSAEFWDEVHQGAAAQNDAYRWDIGAGSPSSPG
jgi:hypothetical protein